MAYHINIFIGVYIILYIMYIEYVFIVRYQLEHSRLFCIKLLFSTLDEISR